MTDQILIVGALRVAPGRHSRIGLLVHDCATDEFDALVSGCLGDSLRRPA